MNNSICPVETTMKAIGGKWKPIILWHLSQQTLRFSELERKIVGISQKMLTQQLREMESDNLVLRKVYPQVPPKVEYSLTPHGRSLEKVIQALSDWGERHYQSQTKSPEGVAIG